jgi:hypothetical protein
MRREGWGENYFFIHIFGGFRKPPKIWAFFQINRTGREFFLFIFSRAAAYARKYFHF